LTVNGFKPGQVLRNVAERKQCLLQLGW